MQDEGRRRKPADWGDNSETVSAACQNHTPEEWWKCHVRWLHLLPLTSTSKSWNLEQLHSLPMTSLLHPLHPGNLAVTQWLFKANGTLLLLVSLLIPTKNASPTIEILLHIIQWRMHLLKFLVYCPHKQYLSFLVCNRQNKPKNYLGKRSSQHTKHLWASPVQKAIGHTEAS